MRRREMIIGATGAAALSPYRALSRGNASVVGVILGYREMDPEAEVRLSALRTRLADLGFAPPRLQLEVRWSGGDVGLMRTQAAELAALPVDVLVVNSTPVLRVVQVQTTTIPVVFAQVTDPIGDGFVRSFARPGGNITGFADFDSGAIAGKWLELLKDAVPTLGQATILFDARQTNHHLFMSVLAATAGRLAIRLASREVRDGRDVEINLGGLAPPRDALIILPGPVNASVRASIITLAEKLRVPAMYPFGYFARAGGLMSYGPDQLDQWPRVATYVARILRGESPGSLPVQAPTRYELILNRRTARAQELPLSSTLLERADEVLE